MARGGRGDPRVVATAKVASLAIRRSRGQPNRHTLSMRVTKLALDAVDARVATMRLVVSIGAATFERELLCAPNASETVATCRP